MDDLTGEAPAWAWLQRGQRCCSGGRSGDATAGRGRGRWRCHGDHRSARWRRAPECRQPRGPPQGRLPLGASCHLRQPFRHNAYTRDTRTSTSNAAHRYRTGTKVQAMYHMTYLYRSEMALAPADKAVRRRALLRAAIGCEQPHHRHGGGDGSHRGAADEQSGACDLAPEAPRLWQA